MKKFRKIGMRVSNAILYIIFATSCSITMAEETLVILAYPKEAKISEKPCYHFIKNKEQMCMDEVIELTYRIKEVLSGKYSEKQISIIDFVHTNGFPQYIIEYPVYLALVKRNGMYMLIQDAKRVYINDEPWICGENLNPSFLDSSGKGPSYVELEDKKCPKGVKVEKLKAYFRNH